MLGWCCSFVVDAVGNGGELTGGYDYSVGGAVGEVGSNVGGLTGGDVEDDVGDDISWAVGIPDGLIGGCVDDMCTYWWLKMINVDLVYV